MSNLLAQLRASWTAGFLFLYVFLVGTPFLLHAWLVGRIDALYRVGWLGAWFALRLAGVRLEVEGVQNLPRDQNCIYMANHQSNVDPPALFVALPPRIAMMGKKELFLVPVFGQVLRLGGFVPIDRANPRAARESIKVALTHVQKGITYLVFPEGTRSPDGCLRRFKHGVFLLAMRTSVPIVPITIDGGDTIMPKKKWQLRPGTFRVTIHPPVATTGLGRGERAALARRVREIVASVLPVEKRGEELPASIAAVSSSDDLTL